MDNRTRLTVLVVVLPLILAALTAQTAGVTRTVLERGDIAVPGREAILGRTNVLAKGSSGWHTHPGLELSYMIEGALTIEFKGRPTQTVKAGESFTIPADAVHNVTNYGTTPVVLIATYIVEKDKPLTNPVK